MLLYLNVINYNFKAFWFLKQCLFIFCKCLYLNEQVSESFKLWEAKKNQRLIPFFVINKTETWFLSLINARQSCIFKREKYNLLYLDLFGERLAIFENFNENSTNSRIRWVLKNIVKFVHRGQNPLEQGASKIDR